MCVRRRDGGNVVIVTLVIGHAVLGVVALGTAGASDQERHRILPAVCAAGVGLGLVLFFGFGIEGDRWRAVVADPAMFRVAGIAVSASWLLAGIAERTRGGGRWDVVAVTGAGCAALSIAAGTLWTVPLLLFASICAGAVAALLDGSPWARAAAGVGALSFAGGLVASTYDTRSWRLDSPLEGAPLWLVAAAAVAFTLAPVVTGLERTRRRGLPGVPLSLGLAFAMLATAGRGAGPVIALVLVLAALAAAVRIVAAPKVGARMVMCWVVLLPLGLAALTQSPYIVTAAAIAAILGASVLELWPFSLGRARIERGIAVAFVAATSGFNAIAAAAQYAFSRATATEDVVQAGPWAAISALLPVALAAGVILGAGVGRNREPEDFSRSAVLGTWLLVVLTVAIGLVPYAGSTEAGGTWRGWVIYVVAVVAGAAAARYGIPPPRYRMRTTGAGIFTESAAPARASAAATMATRGALAVTGVAVLAVTYVGLRNGFL